MGSIGPVTSVLPGNYQLGGVMECADETPAWIMGHHPS